MTNSLEEILLADTVLIIHDGKICQFSPREIIQNEQILPRHGLEVPLLLQIAKKMNASDLQDLRSKLWRARY